MQSGDVDEVVGMWRVMAEQHVAYDAERWAWADDIAEQQAQHLSAALDDPDRVVLVAEGDGRLVGYVSAAVADAAPIWKTRRRAQVFDLFVQPDCRRRGIGARLMRAALDELTRRGAEDVLLRVAAENAAAVRLYEKLALRLVSHEMYGRL
jgi:ribosomal protein S18 acetylase RimI-like enzyme